MFVRIMTYKLIVPFRWNYVLSRKIYRVLLKMLQYHFSAVIGYDDHVNCIFGLYHCYFLESKVLPDLSSIEVISHEEHLTENDSK
jgi:hypothetical protein